MAPLSHKKDLGTSKVGFSLINQSVTLNFELSFNERTLVNIDLRSCVLLSKKKKEIVTEYRKRCQAKQV